MNRELNKEEKDISEKQLKRHKEGLKVLEKNQKFQEEMIELNKVTRDFNEKWAPYKRELLEAKEEQVLSEIKFDIININQHIKQLTHDLKFGVDKSSMID